MGILEDYLDNFGCWNIVTCINSKNLKLIEQVINDSLIAEGYLRISKPPLPENPKPLLQKLLSCSWHMSNLLIIGLLPGNFGWTIVKASWSELFCLRAKNAIYPRLSELAKQIKCDAFVYQVEEPFYFGGLLETNASGKILVSGYLDSYIEHMKFYNEPVTEPRIEFIFQLLDESQELKYFNQKTYLTEEERIKKIEELEKLVEKYPDKINYAFSEYKKIHDSCFVTDNEKLGQLLCTSDSFWHDNKLLLYKAFAEPEQLEKDGVRLLFFQVSQFHLNPNTEEIWSPITSREDYGKDPWQDIDIPF